MKYTCSPTPGPVPSPAKDRGPIHHSIIYCPALPCAHHRLVVRCCGHPLHGAGLAGSLLILHLSSRVAQVPAHLPEPRHVVPHLPGDAVPLPGQERSLLYTSLPLVLHASHGWRHIVAVRHLGTENYM